MKSYLIYFGCIVANVAALFMPGKYKWVNIIVILIIAGFAIATFYKDWQYERRDLGNGMIWSRKYGTYPKEVDFKQGMDLMPGQEAKIEIKFEKESQ